MRHCRAAAEDEMVALFLRTEVTAARFRRKLLRLLQKAGLSECLLLQPDLADPEENRARRELLGEFRGFGRNAEIFQDFPGNVRWYWAMLTPKEVARVKYIDYSYWNELSGGSRLPSDAAPRIRAGIAPFGVSSGWALGFADAVAGNLNVPPMILVAPAERRQLVALEGHARLTAYMLRPEALPPRLLALVGYSPDIVKWGCY